MLFAKDFKTALAVVAVALLGGMAHATVVLSETSAAGDPRSNPPYFAAEVVDTTPTATGTCAECVNNIDGYTDVNSAAWGANMLVRQNEVDVALLNGQRYFLRVELMGGTEFVAGYGGANLTLFYDSTATPGNVHVVNMLRVRGGRGGDDFGIWSFTVDTAESNDATSAVPGNTALDEEVAAGNWDFDIAGLNSSVVVPRTRSRVARTCYGIQVRMYDNLSEAQTAGPDADRISTASADLFCFVPTVSASVGSPQTLTTTVVSNFRRFLGAGAAATSGRLATATVAVKQRESRARPGQTPATGMLPIQNPTDGDLIAAEDVLTEVKVTLEGAFAHSAPFEFGEFSLGGTPMGRFDADGDAIGAAAVNTAAGKGSTDSVQGTIRAVGTYPITVDVSNNDVSNATNPYSAIGAGTYSATWDIDLVGTGADPTQGSTNNAGSIERDGTSVRLGYLTTVDQFNFAARDGAWDAGSGGYNQRLVVTNHSSIAADVTLGSYNAEDGVTVTCDDTDAAGRWECDGGDVKYTVPAGGQTVLRVSQMLDVQGASEFGGRAAGLLTIAVDPTQVSVSTVTVALPDGTTDTVLYWPL